MSRVAILATGGTIVSSGRSAAQMTGYSLEGLRVEDILASVPGISELAKIEARTVCSIPSSSADMRFWAKLAQEVGSTAAGDGVDGIVITHGTDTMEETAFLLNLVLKTEKPVVLTGAMRPATALSADGPVNLYDAVTVAADPQSRGKGVLVVMNGSIFAARDVTKTMTTAVQTFQGRDFGSLGFVLGGRAEYFMQSTRPHTCGSEFAIEDLGDGSSMPRVDIIYAHGGEDTVLLRAALEAGARGIVYAGCGHATLSLQSQDALMEAARSGTAVVRASRTGAGRVVEGKTVWQEAGIIPCGSLNPQKARLLLQLALSRFGSSLPEIRRCFATY